jgi:hypothetical protein
MLEARRTGKPHPKLRHLPLFQPPVSTDSLVSPAGLFKVHFLASGDSTASRSYAEFVAREADAAFRFQCDTLGFPQPAFSFADSMWHVYLIDLSNLTYGYTAYIDGAELGISPAGFTKTRTFIVLDNDYDATPTKGLDAARITIQHEFFHVIQFACYGALEPIPGGYGVKDVNLVEMSSIWMEMRSTPWVPDFLFFLDTYFENIDQTLTLVPRQGYSQGIWPKYIQQKFGDTVIKDLWSNYGGISGDPLEAFGYSISRQHSTFCDEYKRFGAELIQTGRRYRGTTSLPNAEKYPVDLLKVVRALPDQAVFFADGQKARPASLNMVAAGFGEDTAYVAVARSTAFIDLDATVTITGKSTFTKSYQSQEEFCDTLIEYDALKTEAFPIPFIIGAKDNTSVFRLKATSTGAKPVSPPRLTIYTVAHKLVRHTEEDVQPFGGSWYSSWDGKDDTGAFVSSGVYLYVYEVDGETFVGKFPVILSQ